MSGRSFIKLSLRQIAELRSQLKDEEHVLKVTGYCRTVLSGHPVVEIIVDRWPEWRSVVVKPVKDLPEEYAPAFINNIHMYSKCVTSLRDFLGTKGVLDWSETMTFRDIDVKLKPAVEAAAGAQNGTVTTVVKCLIYTVTEDMLNNIDVDLPDGYTVGELSVKDTQKAYDLRASDVPTVHFNMIGYHVKNSLNVCIRDSLSELVGFELVPDDCSQGMLHVDPTHRRRGLGKYLTVNLARKMLKQGMVPYCYIKQNNMASIQFHQTCGYKAVDDFVCDVSHYAPPAEDISNLK